MFQCQVCGTQVPRGVPSTKLVTQTRSRIYSQRWIRAPNTERNKDRYQWRLLPRNHDGGKRHGQPRFIEARVPQHIGWEIAHEKIACPACAARHRRPASQRRVA